MPGGMIRLAPEMAAYGVAELVRGKAYNRMPRLFRYVTCFVLGDTANPKNTSTA